MISRLRGDDRLLHASQKLLRLGQRQTQVRDIAKIAASAELHHVNTRPAAFVPGLDQPQNPPHPRCPTQHRPGQSYRFRRYPPTFWTLPLPPA